MGYLTAREAAKYLGYKTKCAIHSAINRGDLAPDGARPDGAFLFKVETLDRFAQTFLQVAVSARRTHVETQRNQKSWNQESTAFGCITTARRQGGNEIPFGRFAAKAHRKQPTKDSSFARSWREKAYANNV